MPMFAFLDMAKARSFWRCLSMRPSGRNAKLVQGDLTSGYASQTGNVWGRVVHGTDRSVQTRGVFRDTTLGHDYHTQPPSASRVQAGTSVYASSSGR